MSRIGRALSVVSWEAMPEKRARLEIGARDGHVYVKLGELSAILSPDRAEELAVDLRSYALEVRNGGALT